MYVHVHMVYMCVYKIENLEIKCLDMGEAIRHAVYMYVCVNVHACNRCVYDSWWPPSGVGEFHSVIFSKPAS